MNNIAIIGIGFWGRVLLASFLQKTNVDAASSTGNIDNIEKTKSLSNKIKFKSNLEIANDDKVNAVIIAVPVENLYDTTNRTNLYEST